ncbi:hypothetical protein QLX08_008553 [Tetragonisca angustula]|uniref:Uncharacterized protein n=1 Tax=Tetragonisca angustula TaxID=166442 RepID=A0AAW0ZJP5_9HYME
MTWRGESVGVNQGNRVSNTAEGEKGGETGKDRNAPKSKSSLRFQALSAPTSTVRARTVSVRRVCFMSVNVRVEDRGSDYHDRAIRGFSRIPQFIDRWCSVT